MKLFKFGNAAVDADKVEGAHLETVPMGDNDWIMLYITTTAGNRYVACEYSLHGNRARFDEMWAMAEDALYDCGELLAKVTKSGRNRANQK